MSHKHKERALSSFCPEDTPVAPSLLPLWCVCRLYQPRTRCTACWAHFQCICPFAARSTNGQPCVPASGSRVDWSQRVLDITESDSTCNQPICCILLEPPTRIPACKGARAVITAGIIMTYNMIFPLMSIANRRAVRSS
jgi:hypothetical protein